MGDTLSCTILGAGVAGIAAGKKLRDSGVVVEIYEKNSYPGGHSASHQIDGFTFDEGPHISFTKNLVIQEILSLAVQEKYKSDDARILNFWHNYWIRHPVQCNLYGLPQDLIDRCIQSFVLSRNEGSAEISTYAQWSDKHLGKELTKEFTNPYTRKYWTVDPEILTIDWIGKRVYTPHLDELIEGSKHPQIRNHHYITRFRYPEFGGFGQYSLGLSQGLTVSYGHEVSSIDIQRKTIEFLDQKKAYYENLISTLPLPLLITLIKQCPESVQSAAKELSYTSAVFINIGIRRTEELPDAHWMYFYDEDLVFSRIHFPHLLADSNAPKGCGSIQAEIYYSKYKPLPAADLVNWTINDLKKVGILRQDDHILLAQQQQVTYANVLFDFKRKQNLEFIQSFLRQNKIYCAGRYGEWEYFWSDDSIMSGWSAADKIISNNS